MIDITEFVRVYLEVVRFLFLPLGRFMSIWAFIVTFIVTFFM